MVIRCSILFRLAVCVVTALVFECPAAADDGAEIAKRIQSLSRNTQWRLADSIPLNFDTHHPQGMSIVDGHIYLSSVRAINRREGTGEGYLFDISMDGKLQRTLRLEDGAMYHPGGIDAHGGKLWICVAEYRPDSRSRVGFVDLKTWTYTNLLEFPDHLGGIVFDALNQRLVANSWGSRRFYSWKIDTAGSNPTVRGEPVKRMNPTHYIDFQDAQWLEGTSYILCGGLIGLRGPENARISLGGLALLDGSDGTIVHEVPVPLWTERGGPMNQNPFYCELTAEGLRFYFIPEDNNSTMYIYDVDTLTAP